MDVPVYLKHVLEVPLTDDLDESKDGPAEPHENSMVVNSLFDRQLVAASTTTSAATTASAASIAVDLHDPVEVVVAMEGKR